MSCGGDVPYNAGPATASERRVIGAARPGAPSPRCFDASAPKVTAAEVDSWADHMIEKFGGGGNGTPMIMRVVGLLTQSELDTYEEGALERLGERFGGGGGRWTNVAGVKGGGSPEALRTVLDAIDAGVAAGERVVVHCWGGGGRTGNALAGWIAARGGSGEGAEAAAAAVSGYAAEHGLKRRADADGAQQYVAADAESGKKQQQEEEG